MIFFTFFPNYKKKINVNGNAIFSEKIFKRYYNSKKDIVVDTTAQNLFLTPIKKIVSYFYIIYLIIFKKQKEIFTVMLDNNGFYIHALFCFVLKYFCSKIIIYHHSFKYINNIKKILRILSSNKIIHVAISKKQFFFLKKKYNLYNSILMENFIFFTDKNIIKKKFTKKIIFFSSLTNSKGINDFIKLANEFNSNKSLKFEVYGNNCSLNLRNKLNEIKKKKIILNFKENIFGKNKKKVLSNADILIFPSKHKSETTPIILDECINYNIIPISFNVGDIRNQLDNLDLVVENYNSLKKKFIYVLKNYNSYKTKIKILKIKRLILLKKKFTILDNFFK